MKIKTVNDKATVEKLREAIRDNGGYCPCAATKSEDNKCPCKDFVGRSKAGETCHCGLYIKMEE